MPAPLHLPLIRWYRRHRRDLPWRAQPANPYHVLVSELMLQQTQVATVIPYFLRFVVEFPTLADLAAADEQKVLRLWQGLGYYRRARHLQAAARRVMSEHGGRIPSDVATLLTLCGIGPYTAGAIASIAFDRPAPILDGNVARVLCRLDGIRSDPRDRSTNQLLWQRARQILPKRAAGEFNSALMDLGATVCTPRNPHCDQCPLRANCRARAAGLQHKIPPPRKTRATPLEQRWTFAVSRRGRWLIEQRPADGRWPSLWQFATVNAVNGRPSAAAASELLGISVTHPHPIGQVKHTLTHRRYLFTVFTCRATARSCGARKWVTPAQLASHPLPKPHVVISRMIAVQSTAI